MVSSIICSFSSLILPLSRADPRGLAPSRDLDSLSENTFLSARPCLIGLPTNHKSPLPHATQERALKLLGFERSRRGDVRFLVARWRLTTPTRACVYNCKTS